MFKNTYLKIPKMLPKLFFVYIFPLICFSTPQEIIPSLKPRNLNNQNVTKSSNSEDLKENAKVF